MWPLIYYFVGAYIREYQPKFKKYKLLILFIAIILFETLLTYYFANGGPFSKVFNGYGSLTVVATSILFFLVFYNVDFGNRLLRKCFISISSLTLDIYLASYIVDLFVYRYVMTNVFESQYQIIYYFVPIVGTVILTSTTISLLRKSLTKLFLTMWSRSKSIELNRTQ